MYNTKEIMGNLSRKTNKNDPLISLAESGGQLSAVLIILSVTLDSAKRTQGVIIGVTRYSFCHQVILSVCDRKLPENRRISAEAEQVYPPLQGHRHCPARYPQHY